MRGEQIEFFIERPLPQQLACLGERQQRSVHAEHVDVAGIGVRRRRGPAHAMGRHVALIDVEPALPEQLSGVSVETHHAFLLGFAFAGGVLQIEVIAKDHRHHARVERVLQLEALERVAAHAAENAGAFDAVTSRAVFPQRFAAWSRILSRSFYTLGRSSNRRSAS